MEGFSRLDTKMRLLVKRPASWKSTPGRSCPLANQLGLAFQREKGVIRIGRHNQGAKRGLIFLAIGPFHMIMIFTFAAVSDKANLVMVAARFMEEKTMTSRNGHAKEKQKSNH